MTIFEYADVLNRNIIIKRYDGNRFTCEIEDSDLKQDLEDPFLMSAWGHGRSAQDAVDDLVDTINGKVLVLKMINEEELKYQVPHDLSTSKV